MIKKQIGLDVLRIAEQCLGYTSREQSAVMILRDGSRIITKLYIFNTPEGHVLVNLSNTKNTLDFDTEEEFNKYSSQKFEMFKSEKEMYMNFMGMSEETWNAWNGEEE